MSGTDEEEVVSGLLPFVIDGQTRRVPELKWRANRQWQARLQAKFVELGSLPADSPDGIRAMGDAQRELIAAYDTTGALGDLEDMTERDLDAIYNKFLEVSFPQAQSQTALMLTLVRLAAESVQANSTSGPSPTGTSAAPTILRPPSPTARSSSSTRKRRSA